MLLKLISCDVFTNEVTVYAQQSPHQIDIVYTELGSDNDSNKLRTLIQDEIDRADQATTRYDAILLLYGLCGNATVGLHARGTKFVIPRAHDCCTIFLGSKSAFKEHFGDNPSRPFSTAGYMQNSVTNVHQVDSLTCDGKVYGVAEYAEIYGEENAKFIMEQHQPKGHDDTIVYIDTPETRDSGHKLKCREMAEKSGKICTVLEGDSRIIRNLVMGQWENEDFCTVLPGQITKGLYDWNEVIGAE